MGVSIAILLLNYRMTAVVSLRRVVATFLVATLPISVAAAGQSSQAKTFTIFDRTFVRATGAPVTEVVNLAATPGTYDLRIESIGTASAVITVNGTEVASPNDFNSGSRTLVRSISLRATNRLTVELRGAPSGRIRLLIAGVDLDLPAITATMSPALNAFGWSALPVRVTFVCTDSGSGIASCTAPVLVTAEGANQPVTGTAVDRVGNTSSTTVTVSVDKTAPTLVPLVSPPPNVLGWNRTSVTVSFSCADDLSGVQQCSEPATVSVPGHEGANELQGIAVDRAGNRANRSVVVNIDSTPPTIAATPERPPDVDGWYLSPVLITFACADDRSGVALCPAPVRVATVGSGIIVPGTALDLAGNSGSTTFVLNMRSPSPPGLTAEVTPPPNAAGWNNSPPRIRTDQATG